MEKLIGKYSHDRFLLLRVKYSNSFDSFIVHFNQHMLNGESVFIRRVSDLLPY